MADKKKFSRRRKFTQDPLKRTKPALPIHYYEKDLVRAVEVNDFLIVVGETGSGKTTQLPQFLHRSGFTSNGEVIGVTQPRRIAAISVASRVAEEIGCSLGAEVGYQVRFDDCTSSSTVVKYMTDGCLLREFLDDPQLTKYGVIILDEAHERSLDTDILFGLVKELFLIQKSCNSPKVIVMSATLDHNKFSRFFGGCPVFEIPGKCYPVTETYCNFVGVKDLQTPNYVTKAVETVMNIHFEQPAGDILLFLTGQEEIEHACDKLFEKAEKIDYRHDVFCSDVKALLILPFYGSLTTELQRRVFEQVDPKTRKVVVATNIAATSVTIDGIRYVVDSGFVKQLVYNPRTGLDSLNVVLISRSEVAQRTGRAGRTAPGKCYRLYSKDVFDTAMSEETPPEIQRTSLTRVVLHLKTMEIHNVLGFQYIDPPDRQMILEALRQLSYYEALDKDGNITLLGRRMVEFPLSPGLSRAVIYSSMLDCEDLVLPVAAMLSVENVFNTGGNKKQRLKASQLHKKLADDSGGTNDFATLLYIYNQCHSSTSPSHWCREHFVHWRALKMAASVSTQLHDILKRQKQKHYQERLDGNNKDSDSSKRDLLRRVLCKGFFCNVATRSTSGSGFRTMDGHGSTVYIHPSSTLFGCEDKLDWIIYHDIVWTSKIYIRTVCPIRYEWIKDLLPRLHDEDAFALTGLSTNHRLETNRESKGFAEADITNMAHDVDKDMINQVAKLTKRSTKESIAAARERYLARKQARR